LNQDRKSDRAEVENKSRYNEQLPAQDFNFTCAATCSSWRFNQTVFIKELPETLGCTLPETLRCTKIEKAIEPK